MTRTQTVPNIDAKTNRVEGNIAKTWGIIIAFAIVAAVAIFFAMKAGATNAPVNTASQSSPNPR